MAIRVSLDTLIQTGAHFGHQVRRWNPRMSEYIYGVSEGVHVFDLVKTKKALEEALEFLTESAKQNKVIVILGTKKQVKEKVRETAISCGVYYVTERWLGGTISNFDVINKSVRKLTEMKQKMANGEYNKFTKKERMLLEREIERLERFFGGIEGIEKAPDVLIIIDVKKEKGALREASRRGVTSIALVDTNADPTLVDYPVPMNDDASKALAYFLDLVNEAILEGKGTKKLKDEKTEK